MCYIEMYVHARAHPPLLTHTYTHSLTHFFISSDNKYLSSCKVIF